MWCALANRTPTWDRMHKISLEGPGWCTLFKNNKETVNHLFLNCSFTSQVWSHSQAMLNQRIDWTEQSFEDAWKTWSTSPHIAHLKSLPLVHSWGIWIARNKAIFQDKESSPEAIAKHGLDIVSYFPQTKGAPTVRIVTEEQIYPSMPCDYFMDPHKIIHARVAPLFS